MHPISSVAARARIRGGDSVTLWDEIVPPAPRPIPPETSRAVQGAQG